MATQYKKEDWLEVSRTKLSRLPSGSRIVVEDVSPEQFEVTFEPGKMASVFSVFTCNPSQRIRLTRHQVAVFEDVETQVNRNRELIRNGRFDIQTEGDGDDSISRLVLINVEYEFTLVKEPQLLHVDLTWLKLRFNEWLGWEFPSHCVNCGRPLEACDVEWPQRSIDCSVCDFEGPAPDPFEPNNQPLPPVSSCPSCAGEIWLRDVNRKTGGCRCHRCGWVSEALPSVLRNGQIHFGDVLKTALEFGLGLAFHNTENLVPEEIIRTEFPRAQDALRLLEHAGLVTYSEEKSPIVVLNRWRITCVKVTAIVLVMLTMTVTGLLISVWSVSAEQRTWGQFLTLVCYQTLWLIVAPSLGGLVWWANHRTQLIFAPTALFWRGGQQTRLLNWQTLTAVAVSQGGWLPMVFFKHGGAGLGLATPSQSIAKALARLCQIHCEDASRSSVPTLANE